MRKFTAMLLACALMLCGVGARAETEVVVFAAASLTETLTEISERYMAEHPGVKIVCSFDSSGTLKTQIQEGADCDLFISAAQRQMDELDAGDLVDGATRAELLENRVVLAVPEGNPAGLDGFGDLSRRLSAGGILLAVGNGDVPVGQYTRRIFEYLGIDEAAVSGNLTYGSNVKEVVAQVREGSVDGGIVYGTDAAAAGLHVVDVADEAMCGGRVVYPAAALKAARQPGAAHDFLSYLQTDPCAQIFAAAGFTPIAQ